MAIEAAGRAIIHAPLELCFAAAADFERYDLWARDVQRVTVLERDGEGRPRRVEFLAAVYGRELVATLGFDFFQAPERLTWTLVESPKLRTLTGSFEFEPNEDATDMTFRLQGVLVKPKRARVERMMSRRIETIVLRNLRRHIERNLVRHR